jgi:hypothetical protein
MARSVVGRPFVLVPDLKAFHRLLVYMAVMLGGTWGFSGCGGPSNIGTVSGVVTLNGQPLPDALVMFSPEAGSPSAGRTDDQGRYTLEYTADIAGAEVGKHRVSITTFQAASPDADPPRERVPEIVPPKYNVASELSVTVEPGSNEHNFELTSQGRVIQPEQRRE